MIDPILIERLADSAWPAAEQKTLGPWKLRATQGVTRRANSVFTACRGVMSTEEMERLVAQAERFYSRRSLPPVFQVSVATTPVELDHFLERRGYGISGAAEIWTAETCHAPPAGSARTEWKIPRQSDPDDAWFDCAFDEPPDRRRIHEQIVRRVPHPRVFIAAVIDGQVAGCGMAASAQGHTGIFCMSTQLQFRRRGVASSIVRELCHWAHSQGDGLTFLQVMTDNQPAKALYKNAGFRFGYHYHYRMR